MVSGSSHLSESEYAEYIPGKCVYCGSSNVTEILKKIIKGSILNGYLWNMSCTDCGSKWIALEKPINDGPISAQKIKRSMGLTEELESRRRSEKHWLRNILLETVPFFLLNVLL